MGPTKVCIRGPNCFSNDCTALDLRSYFPITLLGNKTDWNIRHCADFLMAALLFSYASRPFVLFFSLAYKHYGKPPRIVTTWARGEEVTKHETANVVIWVDRDDIISNPEHEIRPPPPPPPSPPSRARERKRSAASPPTFRVPIAARWVAWDNVASPQPNLLSYLLPVVQMRWKLPPLRCRGHRSSRCCYSLRRSAPELKHTVRQPLPHLWTVGDLTQTPPPPAFHALTIQFSPPPRRFLQTEIKQQHDSPRGRQAPLRGYLFGGGLMLEKRRDEGARRKGKGATPPPPPQGKRSWQSQRPEARRASSNATARPTHVMETNTSTNPTL